MLYLFIHICVLLLSSEIISNIYWYWEVIWSRNMKSQDRKVSGSNYFQISLVQNLVTSCRFFAISVSIHARHLIPTSSKLFIGQWLKAVRTVQLTDTTTSLHKWLGGKNRPSSTQSPVQSICLVCSGITEAGSLIHQWCKHCQRSGWGGWNEELSEGGVQENEDANIPETVAMRKICDLW